MKRDIVFLPKTREVYASRVRKRVGKISKLIEEAPLVTALVLTVRQLIDLPVYLVQNNAGHNHHERQSQGRGIGKGNGRRAVSTILAYRIRNTKPKIPNTLP